MDKFCRSCAAPLAMPDFKGPTENYCKYCTDEKGVVKTREAVQAGVAQWFLTWQPGVDAKTADQRAATYLKAMPHWAG
jgi:hypothetical protein